MTSPRRYLIRMTMFLGVVAIIIALLGSSLYSFFLGNPAINGIIVGIMLAGTIYIFRQVLLLDPEVAWIESFRRNKGVMAPEEKPRLLLPMAHMLAERKGGRVSLSAVSLRTLLDGISTRLDETRETSRYLIGLLVFLGLLGTFFGLLETVRSVGGVIGGLTVTGNDVASTFNNLKTGLQAPLSGMSTAFSSSLFGLAGSLVLGFLDLQAGQAQNRFYNDLEEWLSGYTRLSSGTGPMAEGGDASVPAYIQALLEQSADSLDGLQRILGRGEESRIAANNNVVALTERLGLLTEQMKAQQNLLLRMAEQQIELRPVLARLADATASALNPDEQRNHLRNIEIYLARLTEDVTQGRSETIQELRTEIRLVARTIAALAEEAQRQP